MKTIDLGGTWSVSSHDGSFLYDGNVPGTVFQYMEEAGIFGREGVFYREENRKCVDLARNDFTFSRTFPMDQDFLDCGAVFLEAEGLDTLASISINNKHIADTKNMHRRYRFDVKDALVPGENRIDIFFSNPLDYVDEEHGRRRLGHSYWQMPDYAYQGFNMIRKSHCSFGWDWGPIIPDIGIWRSIALKGYSGAGINGVHVVQSHMEDGTALIVEPDIAYCEGTGEHDITVDLTVTAPDGTSSYFLVNRSGPTRIIIDNPVLWWPNGLGDQNLYRLVFVLNTGSAESDRLEMTIGLRTMAVRREKDERGESFAFEVNGTPVFARGADYIPEDVFLCRMTEERTETLIRACAAANFNCIRVWGGGVYPPDGFFDLCDRYGMIVWEDLMFACASYDVNNPEFLENITEEVRDNLSRIRHHASLGLICGNNEMEWGTKEWEPRPSDEMVDEYLKQYESVFPEIVKEVCPEVFYWPSSPSSGGSFDEPNSPDRGDTHFWEVWHGSAEYGEYTKHYFRFMSEFGFESFPSMKTVRSFTNPGDRNIFSPVMEDHQRCKGGNGKILDYVARYFRYPKNLDSLLYVSQISQAEAMRYGIEHWRRNRGRCMGAVYWQLNDNWPAASWSSIDYYGRWKALHYTAKRAFGNVLLSIAQDQDETSVHLSNEGRDPVNGRLEWRLTDTGGTIEESAEIEASAGPFESRKITVPSLGGVFAEELRRKTAGRDFILFADFTDDSGNRYRAFSLFVPYKSLSLKAPGITYAVAGEKDEAVITLESEYPALFVELNLKEADTVFSDNYFFLDGLHPVTVRAPKNGLGIQAFKSQIIVRSLVDSY